MKRKDVWVSAEAPQPTAPAAPTRPAPTSDGVTAKWRDNLGMGIGVFCALVSGFFIAQVIGGKVGIWRNIWSDLDGTLTWIAFSVLAGVQAFGWLMIWRSSIDEFDRQVGINAMKARIADDDDYINKLEERVANQEQTIANLKQDLAERMMLQQRAEMRANQRTYTPSVEAASEPVDSSIYRDARLLVERACRNQPYSKDKICAMFGWSQGQWRAAHQLAQDAGLFRVVGNRTELLVDDLNTALSIMDVYAGSASYD